MGEPAWASLRLCNQRIRPTTSLASSWQDSVGSHLQEGARSQVLETPVRHHLAAWSRSTYLWDNCLHGHKYGQDLVLGSFSDPLGGQQCGLARVALQVHSQDQTDWSSQDGLEE